MTRNCRHADQGETMGTPLKMMEERELLAGKPGEGAALKTAEGHLPLIAMDVRARIVGVMAHVVVTQVFRNAFSVPLEATYIFPLPDKCAVTGFGMRLKSRRVDGILKERSEARA